MGPNGHLRATLALADFRPGIRACPGGRSATHGFFRQPQTGSEQRIP